MTSNADELLKEWYHKADNLENAHMEASNYYHRKDTYITIPSIVISALSGSISFTTTGLKEDIKNLFLYITGILSVVNTIIASVKEYFSWNQKKYNHSTAAIAYHKLKNYIEIQLSLHKMGLPLTYDKIITEIGNLIIKIDNESPQLPEFIRKRIDTNDKIIDIMVNTNTEEEDSSINEIINRINNNES